jgi:hypothetical protein
MLYVFALVDGVAKAPRWGTAFEGARVRRVHAGRWSALVATWDAEAAPAPSQAHLVLHDAVLRRAGLAARAVLPMRFGTIVKGARELAERLATRVEALDRELARVAGRAQMTLRVFAGKCRAAKKDGGAEEARGAGPGTRYLARRRRALAAATADPALVAPIERALKRFVRARTSQAHDAAPLVASLYHLVDKDDAPAYKAALARALPALLPTRVTCTGPWPPYAFAGAFVGEQA